mgnify:CR=1 FL=1
MPAARSDSRKAATLPISSIVTLRRSGAFVSTKRKIFEKPPMPLRPQTELRPISFTPHFLVHPEGSVLVAFRHASPEAREGLLAFYRHLAEGHRQLALARSTLYLPLNLEAQEAWRKEEVGRLLLGQKPRLAPWHQEAPLLLWAPPLEEALEKALKGNVPPQKALEEAQARASRMP